MGLEKRIAILEAPVSDEEREAINYAKWEAEVLTYESQRDVNDSAPAVPVPSAPEPVFLTKEWFDKYDPDRTTKHTRSIHVQDGVMTITHVDQPQPAPVASVQEPKRVRLTKAQWTALEKLAASKYGLDRSVSNGIGCMHWKAADSLVAHGLASIYGGVCKVTDAGRAALQGERLSQR